MVPTGKFAPLPGVQLTVTGASPPVTVGVPYVTATGFPSNDGVADAAAGHAMTGAGPGGVGVVVLSHPLAITAAISGSANQHLFEANSHLAAETTHIG